ncbi:FtsK/SpoIIIE domain-containing protein [Pseudonocardia sp. 73-21]|uniref:FtsK/SpoIIIE domain-containing protein n=1 Tax=Pseudonocardia sp. 73-21 TaxID=1895809 RepID=UPI0009697131|nr:FtsK/SpoIIIE domain-containing protein [Pseudonocardia sp. 73-21]OJY48848.1 MAG: cell division protein FtsK [Pseudonocardia sp. 73-21]
MIPFIGRRRRIRAAYDALCDAIAAASGASDAARETARRAHLDALAELWLRQRGLDAAETDPELRALLHSPGLAHVVRAIDEDRAASTRPADTALPDLDELVARAAPGAAGEAGQGWLGKVGDIALTDDAPELWRVGAGRLGVSAPPFPVAVPLLDDAHLQVSAGPDERAAAIALVEGLVMRIMSTFRPGCVHVHVWDVGQLTGPLPGLHPLTRTGLLTVHDPSGLERLLEDLSDRIRRVHTRVLVDGHPSLRAMQDITGERTEPWVVAVLVGNRQPLRDDDQRQLQRVASGGLACGVQLVTVDVPIAVGASVETVDIGRQDAVRTSMTQKYVAVELDPVLPPAEVTEACHAIAGAHEELRSRLGTFDDLLVRPDKVGTESSAKGLHFPIGFTDGHPVPMTLGDASPHALVGGPSGSGKTNFLLAMIAALTTRYPPGELELHLLDFKEGVSFAQFAPGRRSETWLPQARLIGININTDREFGLALLQHLADEMRRRAALAKEHEVTKLEELRDEDGVEALPRIVAVIDEFQYLFAEKDAVTRAAIGLLEDVARRGRSQGIHLVLASQDVSGIEAFWGRPAIFEQFVLRVALPRARRVLHEQNDAAMDLPRWHAVLNHESGMRHGNEIIRLPNASVKGTLDKVQQDLHKKYGDKKSRPRLFDGNRAPKMDELVDGATVHGLRVRVGQKIDFSGTAATVGLSAVPGRNLGVFGAGTRDAVRVLDAAAASLVSREDSGEPSAFEAAHGAIVLAPLVAEAVTAAERLQCAFRGAAEIVRLDGFRARVEAIAAEVTARLAGNERAPLVLVVYAADAADTALDRTGTEALRKIIHFGPEVGVHVLGWWRSVPRLKTLLMMGAAVDDLGAWVALDVQGTELQSLLPGMLVTWSPRPGRGFFFDRSQHSAPEVVIVPASAEEKD